MVYMSISQDKNKNEGIRWQGGWLKMRYNKAAVVKTRLRAEYLDGFHSPIDKYWQNDDKRGHPEWKSLYLLY